VIVLLQISAPAARFYKREMELNDGDGLKLFVRYGGMFDYSYSLGVEKGLPTEDDIIKTVNGIMFFTSPDDLWFTDHILLDFDEEESELVLLRTA